MRSASPRLALVFLEDRCTPAGSQVPAGEFNWMQFAPDGRLAQLIWDGRDLVFRNRSGTGWAAETVARSDSGQESFDFRDAFAPFTRTAQLLFTPDNAAHAFVVLRPTEIDHFRRDGGVWKKVETLAPGVSGTTYQGFSHVTGDVGPDGSIHLALQERIDFAFGPNNGAGAVRYATNSGGSWRYEVAATTGDVSDPVRFGGERYAPRFLSLAVDSQNKAHVAYMPLRSVTDVTGALSASFSQLGYATNRGGAWAQQIVMQPGDPSGDAGLAASVAVGPGDQVAIASYYVERTATGSPESARLMFHTLGGAGTWSSGVVATAPDGYAAADGAKFTGFQPQLLYNAAGVPQIVFSDAASFHNPFANEMAGQVRLATLGPSGWGLQTVFRQSNPLIEEVYYPVAAERQGALVFAGLRGTNRLDGQNNVIGTDYALFDVGAPDQPAPPLGAGVIGADAGAGPLVKVYRQDGSEALSFFAFEESFTGGVRVAGGDVDGDGVREVIAGPGPGRAPVVRIFRGTDGAMIAEVPAFEASFTGGVFVAAGDLDGDGFADFAVSPDEGGGPRVRAFNGKSLAQLADFFGIEDPNFRGGARAAIGDVNGDGRADLLVAAGFGGGPRLAGFDGKSLGGTPVKLFGDFFVFEQSLRNGVFVTAGDLTGDGFAEVIVGGGPGGGPRVFALSGKALMGGSQEQAANFFAGDANSRGGVRLTTLDLDGDPRADLLTGAGPGAGSRGTAYLGKDVAVDGTPPEFRAFDAIPGFGGGIFVG